MEPERSENALWAALAHETFSHGELHAEARLLCWGPRTNPWMQEATHRVVQNGDLVAFDNDLVGPFGYLTDITRTTCVATFRPPAKSGRYTRRRTRTSSFTGAPEFVAGRSFADRRAAGERVLRSSTASSVIPSSRASSSPGWPSASRATRGPSAGRAASSTRSRSSLPGRTGNHFPRSGGRTAAPLTRCRTACGRRRRRPHGPRSFLDPPSFRLLIGALKKLPTDWERPGTEGFSQQDVHEQARGHH